MERAWKIIELAEQIGATHVRKGFTLDKASVGFILDHAREELDELEGTVLAGKPDIEELGDVLSILVHFAVRHRWSMKEVEQAMIDKLLERLDFHESRDIVGTFL